MFAFVGCRFFLLKCSVVTANLFRGVFGFFFQILNVHKWVFFFNGVFSRLLTTCYPHL